MFGTSKHVLVVDDEEALSDAISSVIRAWGRIFTTRANSVQTAVAVMEEKAVDLIITDINMAVHSGYELVKFAFQNHPDVPVILISGKVNIYDDHDCDEEVFKHIYAFFEKPFDFGELKQTVHEALEKGNQKKAS